jgi:cytochrome c biogenesis protein
VHPGPGAGQDVPPLPLRQVKPLPKNAAAAPRAARPFDWSPGALWDRCSRMRFALWLLLITAVGSVVGVIVSDGYPTNSPNWEQLAERKAGPALYPVLKFFGMFDPFRSWWFRSLLLLLTVSLLACAIKRGRGVWRRALYLSWLDEGRFYERYDHHAVFESKGSEPLAALGASLRRGFYQVRQRPGPGGSQLLAAGRGSWARFGPFLSHVGLLFLLVGGLLSTAFGLKTMLWLAPGDSTDELPVGEMQDKTVPLPFTFAVDDFNVELNAQGMVKQYRSDVTVTPKTGAPFSRQIAVNHPLRYAGYNFYQASYEPVPDRVKSLVVAVRDTLTGRITPDREIRFGEHLDLGDGYEAIASKYLPDARVGPNGLQNVSSQANNPAFYFRIYRGGEEVGYQWSFPAFEMPFGPWQAKHIAVHHYEPAYATGLEVTRAPMSIFIWMGIILSSIGLVLSFNVAHRQFWALAEPDGRGGWLVHVAAFTNRGIILFGNDFRRAAEKWGGDPAVRNLRVYARTDAKEKAS